MKNKKDDLEAAVSKELEDARENDYVLYFSLLTEDLALEENGEEKLLQLYDEHWEKVKEALSRDYFFETADGVLAKPSPNSMLSLQDGYGMFYGNIINDIDMALNSARRYDDRVSFARDCLEYFDLHKGDGSIGLDFMNFSLAIGEALSDGGHIEESDAYYAKLLAEYPDNGYMIANYVLTLKTRGEKEKAKRLLEAHISPDMEPVEENEMLFERAQELYHEEGNDELVKKYESLKNQIYKNARRIKLDNAKNYFSAEPDEESSAGKKIYPNDPCPCGSGKKYKKCCGR